MRRFNLLFPIIFITSEMIIISAVSSWMHYLTFTSWNFYNTLIVIFWILGYEYIILMSIILILTVFSRLITNSHTLSQTIVGALIGLVATYTQLVLLFI